MKLTHAIKIVEKLDERLSQSTDLTAEERVALQVLLTMAKRVLNTRPSLRAVVAAVYGEDMNQSELSDLFKKS